MTVAIATASARLAAEREALESARPSNWTPPAGRQPSSLINFTAELEEGPEPGSGAGGGRHGRLGPRPAELRQRLAAASGGARSSAKRPICGRKNEQLRRAAAAPASARRRFAGKLETLEAQNAALLAPLTPGSAATPTQGAGGHDAAAGERCGQPRSAPRCPSKELRTSGACEQLL